MNEDESSDLCPSCRSELEYIPWLGDLMCPNCNETVNFDD
jgi:predicted RNA-binding Zn-ribbon protein involved in translation (DUF1610 family)